jgi:DNA-directed RNA polymerase subunit RPC12/RpoP
MGIITDLLKEIPLSAVLRERLVDLETKMDLLEKKLEKCESEKKVLHLQIEKIKKNEAIEGDVCPYCRQHKGQLLRLEPHPIFGDVGIKVGFYKCSNCSKEYEKEHQP